MINPVSLYHPRHASVDDDDDVDHTDDDADDDDDVEIKK